MNGTIEILLSGKAAAHLRTIYLTGGDAWVSAAACGGEISLCAMADGVRVLMNTRNRAYLPLSWLEREFPKKGDQWAMVRHRIEQAKSLPIENDQA